MSFGLSVGLISLLKKRKDGETREGFGTKDPQSEILFLCWGFLFRLKGVLDARDRKDKNGKEKRKHANTNVKRTKEREKRTNGLYRRYHERKSSSLYLFPFVGSMVFYSFIPRRFFSQSFYRRMLECCFSGIPYCSFSFDVEVFYTFYLVGIFGL